ncbi:hypothetical protein IQ263_03185 [Tychonema sp. LEGE 06208]|nr:hypothetical protein [Tychonema sp. LEGE 06208]
MPYPAHTTTIFNNWYEMEDCPFFVPSCISQISTQQRTFRASCQLFPVSCQVFHLSSSIFNRTDDVVRKARRRQQNMTDD